MLIFVMFFIALFNFLVIKILNSTKKNKEVEKNLEQVTSKQQLLMKKYKDED